jgi:LPS export ABC transporter protein LptC
MTGVGHHVNWMPLGLALLLAMLGFWLNHVGERVETVDNAGFTHDPDYFVENFDALAFDTDGKPYQRLAAARMMHYMDDDTTVLDKPRLRILDPLTPVSVTAGRALLSSDGNQVYFLDRSMSSAWPATAPRRSPWTRNTCTCRPTRAPCAATNR